MGLISSAKHAAAMQRRAEQERKFRETLDTFKRVVKERLEPMQVEFEEDELRIRTLVRSGQHGCRRELDLSTLAHFSGDILEIALREVDIIKKLFAKVDANP